MINRMQIHTGNLAASKSEIGLRSDFHAKTLPGETSVEETSALVFQVDGESFQIEEPKQIEAVRTYLAKGESETVAAALYKNIEPTQENLALISQALNESPFDAELETECEEASFPRDACERLKEAMERSRAAQKQNNAVREENAPSPRPAEVVGSLRAKITPETAARIVKDFAPPRDISASEEAVHADETGLNESVKNEEMIGEQIMDLASQKGLANTLGVQKSCVPLSDVAALLAHAVAPPKERPVLGLIPLAAIEKEPPLHRLRGETAEATNGRKSGLGALSNVGAQPRGDAGVGQAGVDPAHNAEARSVRSNLESAVGVSAETKKENGHGDLVRAGDTVPASEPLTDFAADNASGSDEPLAAAGSDESPDAVLREEMLSEILAQLLVGLESTNALLGVKRFEETKLTDMMVSATSEFRTFQMDVERVLSKVTPASVKAAIDLLSRAVNKSSFSLLADMRSEKTLLLALSRLDQAGEALRNKQFESAERMVREVAKEIGEMVFQPSVRRVHAFAEYDMRSNLRLLEKRPVTMGEKLADALSLFSETRGRDVLELLRFTGTNHEIEVFENTAAKSDIPNLKELFGDTSYASGMSGGQMLNDSGGGRKREFYVFDLPMRIDEEIKDLKVFVNGRSENNGIDWKNAELYFGLMAKNDERIGMKFSIRGGGLSVEVLADRQMDLSGLDEDLRALGFQMLSVRQFPYRKIDRLHLHVGSEEVRCETDRADHRNREREDNIRFDYRI